MWIPVLACCIGDVLAPTVATCYAFCGTRDGARTHICIRIVTKVARLPVTGVTQRIKSEPLGRHVFGKTRRGEFICLTFHIK